MMHFNKYTHTNTLANMQYNVYVVVLLFTFIQTLKRQAVSQFHIQTSTYMRHISSVHVF